MRFIENADSIIFDLDGTLWDATSVTAEAWVEVLARHPDVKCDVYLDCESIRRYMGLTNEELARIFFPSMPFDEAFSLMTESCEIENTRLPVCGGILYDGAEETLNKLHDTGKGLFIVSNCQDGYIEAFLHAHKFETLFCDIECSGRTGLCKTDNVRLIMKRNGLTSPVLVGDTVSDGTAARNAGIPFIYAKYGFGERYGRGKTEDFDVAIDKLCDLM